MSIHVARAGAFTTVQDCGRHGWQRHGVTVGGAMDDVALRLANWLVGNAANAGVLEATLRGPALVFEHHTRAAIAGGDMDARLGDRRVAPWRAFDIPAGGTLTLDTARVGCRCYIAVAGGIDVPMVLGSRSTYVRAQLGGVSGRALERGDTLTACLKPPSGEDSAPGVIPGAGMLAGRGVDVRHLDLQRNVARMVAGPHLRRLDKQSRRALFATPFTLTPASDRMGLRLSGVRLKETGPFPEPLSGGVAMGTVQLPPGGSPIVLMADRQTTGGYPRLGEIATVDLPVLAQLRPGEEIRFAEISADAAEQLYLEREREMERLRWALEARR